MLLLSISMKTVSWSAAIFKHTYVQKINIQNTHEYILYVCVFYMGYVYIRLCQNSRTPSSWFGSELIKVESPMLSIHTVRL